MAAESCAAGAGAKRHTGAGFLWMNRRIAVDLTGVEAYKRGSLGEPGISAAPGVPFFDIVERGRDARTAALSGVVCLRILVGIVLSIPDARVRSSGARTWGGF